MSVFFRRFAKRKAELDEEIQAHLEMDIQARMERGESAEGARAAAMRELGNVALIEEVTREMWGWVWLERVGQDLKYAIRQLRRSPLFTVTVVGMLALGVGATAAMFTVVDRVLLRPLPYKDSGQLVEIKEAGSKGVMEFGTPFLDVQQWGSRGHELEEIALYDTNKHVSFLEGSAGSTQVSAPQVSANMFAVLGVHPALGREFDGRRDNGSVVPEQAQSIILSDPVWREAYGGDENILGRTVRLNGKPYVVLGVMPRGFTFPFDARPAVWLPIVIGEKDAVRKKFESPYYQVIGRLRAGASVASAESELEVIQPGVAKAYTDPDDRELVSSVKVQRYDDTLVGSDLRKAVLALFGASSVLWLIACVNGTSLMLARASARQTEIAVRGALGASRWRIVQQLAIEGLVLSAIASALGSGLAMLMLKLFEHGLKSQFHIQEKMVVSVSVIGLLVGLTVASALLCSVWPAIASSDNRKSLIAHCTPVELPLKTLLYAAQEIPRYAYFMTSGLATAHSLFSATSVDSQMQLPIENLCCERRDITSDRLMQIGGFSWKQAREEFSPVLNQSLCRSSSKRLGAAAINTSSTNEPAG